jgi:hypothetical protein
MMPMLHNFFRCTYFATKKLESIVPGKFLVFAKCFQVQQGALHLGRLLFYLQTLHQPETPCYGQTKKFLCSVSDDEKCFIRLTPGRSRRKAWMLKQ